TATARRYAVSSTRCPALDRRRDGARAYASFPLRLIQRPRPRTHAVPTPSPGGTMRRLPTLLLYLLLLPLVAAAAAPPLMLAGQWRDGPDVSRYWVSEKLDGVRARWDGQA